MYDKHAIQLANSLNRFAIDDREELKYNADNWLSSP
jgi:hypothetical protein